MTLQPKTRTEEVGRISFAKCSKHNVVYVHSKQVPEYLAKRFEIVKSGCWEWRASLTESGYGRVDWNGRRQRMAHKVMYQLLVGEIPEGLELDHLCKVRHCVNPAHLEAVTRQENLRRSDCESSRNRLKTHCPKGHQYSEKNTLVNKGKRYCRTCADLSWARWNAKKKVRQ